MTTYELDELMGTKVRALYQRRKGRDLFDLWLCIDRKLIDPDQVITCFRRYMEHGREAISRAEFEMNLHDKEHDPGFMDDIRPLLNPAIQYDSTVAMKVVHQVLIRRIPGEPWRGEVRS